MNNLPKNLLAATCLFPALLIIGGCSAVVAPEPIGQPVTKKKTLDLTGVWKLQSKNNPPSFIYVQQSDQGKLQLATIKFEKGKFQLTTKKARLTQNKGAYYINFPYKVHTNAQGTKKQAQRRGYTFAKIILRGDKLIIFPVNTAYFKHQVSSGAIQGKVVKPANSGYRIYLDLDQAALGQLFAPDKAGQQFKIQKADALIRVGHLDIKGHTKADETGEKSTEK